MTWPTLHLRQLAIIARNARTVSSPMHGRASAHSLFHRSAGVFGLRDGSNERLHRMGKRAELLEQVCRIHEVSHMPATQASQSRACLPQVEGWPRHVLAPRASSIPAEQLLAENTTHAAAVLAEEAKAATAATAPSSDQQWLVESSLRKARGRLAATMAELRLRGLPD